MSKKITFSGFNSLISKTPVSINIKELSKPNNYFENTDIDIAKKLRIWIDLDGNVEYDDYTIEKFVKTDKKILKLLNSIDNISIITSSHYDCEKWTWDKDTKKTLLEKTSPKFSYRITYINEYCESLEDIRYYVINQKQKELQELFSESGITIGTSSSCLINIDTQVYRRGTSKMRCVNAYKFAQQQDRINRLVKGTIEDTIISYIPDDAVNCYTDDFHVEENIKKTSNKSAKKITEIIESKSKEDDDKVEEKEKKIGTKIVVKSTKEIEEEEKLKQLLDGLSEERYTKYEYWIIVYWIFLNEKLNMDLFTEFSKKDPKYNEANNLKVFKYCKVCDGYKIATLYYWLKEDNYRVFCNLQKKRDDIWNLIIDMNHSDLAKFYFSVSPTKYVRGNSKGWFEYNNYNVLLYRDTIPSSFLNDITNTLQYWFLEQRNQILPDDPEYNMKIKINKKAYITVGNNTYAKGILEYLKNLYFVENLHDLLDARTDLLAFTNYVYDMSIKSFREISPKDYITKTTGYPAPIKYDKYGNITFKSSPETRETIEKFLFSIFEDKDMVEYVKIISGLTLFTTKLQSIFIHQGTGGNGKGILSKIMEKCLGNYSQTAENTFLTTTYKAGGTNSTLSQCVGVKYLSISEPDNGDNTCKFNVDFIKSMSGGDKITTRGLFKDSFSFIPQFTANVQCNNKPKLGKMDKGIVRRVKIIPYKLSFVDNPSRPNERKRDYNLSDKITTDTFRNEFIYMLIEKATEYYDKDYGTDIKVPSQVLYETGEYINDNNPVKDWIEKRLILTDNPKDRVKTTEINKAYNDDDNEVKLNPTDMVNFMIFNGMEIVKTNGVRYYIKCKLKPLEDEEADKADFVDDLDK